MRSEQLLRRIHQSQLLSSLAATPRFNDPLRLLSSGYKVYSEGYEDGMIAEVFRRIGTTSRRFIEFGVQSGLECNTTFLLVQGWSGAWIEGSAASAREARTAFASFPVEIHNDFVTAENADELISRLADEAEPDLLSIDIDSNDYWVWKAITSVRPRLVVIEYNATLPPHVRKTMAYDPRNTWDGGNYFGASLGALAALAETKGYALVGCSPAGVNAFFVRDDLLGDHFCRPCTAINHYEPPRYLLAGPAGHRPAIGPWVEV
ncbi:hypothetical protein [Microbaculum marinum]|uniref:Uncharacterized protein n=1 Tax=Microbaculum marinum TaxID=1764581 RepID=A0AAW9RGP4_9HYPH